MTDQPLSKRQQRRLRQKENRNTAKRLVAKRAKLWAETGGRCVYCGCATPDKERTMDHLWPRSKGGTCALENLIPACAACNVLRANRFPASPLAHPDLRGYVQKKESAQGYCHSHYQKPSPACKSGGKSTKLEV